jgi:hypothetical protein
MVAPHRSAYGAALVVMDNKAMDATLLNESEAIAIIDSAGIFFEKESLSA